jgi:hypothetical protein
MLDPIARQCSFVETMAIFDTRLAGVMCRKNHAWADVSLPTVGKTSEQQTIAAGTSVLASISGFKAGKNGRAHENRQ